MDFSRTMGAVAPTTASVDPTAIAPSQTNSAVVGVVIVLILLSLAAFGFLLYRYLCRNKGAYRTTGELAPGEDPDQVYNDTVTPIKKEYFI